MTYEITYNADSDPTDITFSVTSITQELIDYLLANDSLSITGRNNYYLTINRGGANILGQFDNGGIVLYVAEDATPETFAVASGHIYGYEQEDYNELFLRIASVINDIPNALTNG